MKEKRFIDQNQKKWAKFEALSKSSNPDPEEIGRLFVEITDDLSYARTNYQKRTVRVYLNQLAQSVFLNLHKARKANWRRLLTFWIDELPLEMYRARKVVGFTFLFFVFSMLIGIISTDNDPDFLATYTGTAYLDFTDAAIERGDPAAIYSESGESDMFAYIASNNLRVALYSFAFGILFSIGALIFMMYNGIMVGSFWYYFYIKGAFVAASSAIWIHGAFEITMIILCGAAGLVVGNSLLFPGSYTRGQSLLIGGKRGIKMMIGAAPYIVIAAFLESYVTRHYQSMNPTLNWIIIFGSLVFVLGYFVVFPYLKFRNKDSVHLDKEPVFVKKPRFNIWKIRKINEVFTDSFRLFGKVWKGTGLLIGITFLLHAALVVTYIGFHMDNFIIIMEWQDVVLKGLGILPKPDFALIGINVAFLAFNLSLILAKLKAVITEKSGIKFGDVLFNWMISIPFVLLPLFLIMNSTTGFFILYIASLPVLLMTVYSLAMNRNLDGVTNGVSAYFDGLGTFLLFFLVITMCHFMIQPLPLFGGVVMLPTNVITSQVSDMILWHTIPLMDFPMVSVAAWEFILYLGIAYFIIPLFFFSTCLLYHTQEEKRQAIGLYDRLKKFGKSNKIYETPGEL